MTDFLGEYEVSIDVKGRFLLPSAFRKQLSEGMGEKFVISKGFDKCLTLYTMDVWGPIHSKISKLNDFIDAERNVKRAFLYGATVVEVDAAGRLLLPKSLAEHANITKDMIMAPAGNKMELWNKANLEAHMNATGPMLSAYADIVGKTVGNIFDI